ncbi:hypothetical protein C8R43DRAFT_1010005 [Mycena crocata]|nr:hypothetical protein C8R43DRAFT_1010005 [Mycena crocata]
MDPNQAIRYIKGGLSNLHHPPACALPLLLPSFSLLDGKNGKTDLDIVWPTVIWFLTAKRSPEQFKQLMLDFNTCRCPVNTDLACRQNHALGLKIFNGRWANLGLPQATTYFHCLMFTLFAALFEYLQPLGVTTTAKGRNVWPKTPSDLIPHGATVTIESMEQWLENLRDPAPSALMLLSELIRLCRTLIVPSVVASHKLPALVIASMLEACEETKGRMKALSFGSQRRVSAACAFNQRISYVELFLGRFSSKRTNGAITFVEFEQFWGKKDKRFFDAVNMVLQIYTQSPLFPPGGDKDPSKGGPRESAIAILREVTATMILSLNEKYGTSRDALESGAREMSDSWENRDTDLRMKAFAYLQGLKVEERCAKIGCTESLQTSETLKRCSGCKILCWCSKDHQKVAWTDPRCPHREVCKLLSRFVDAAGGDLTDLDTFTRNAPKINAADGTAIDAWYCLFQELRDNNAHNAKSVFQTLGRHLQRAGCSAIGCTNATASTASSNLKCSRCGVFRYCNAQCQLKGWKDPKASHKEICTAVNRVVQAGGGDLSDVQTVSRKENEGLISPADIDLIGKWFVRFNEHSKTLQP